MGSGGVWGLEEQVYLMITFLSFLCIGVTPRQQNESPSMTASFSQLVAGVCVFVLLVPEKLASNLSMTIRQPGIDLELDREGRSQLSMLIC